MKNKAIISAVVIILLSSAVSASASNDHSNQRSALGENNRVENHKEDNDNKNPLPTSHVEENDDCDDNVKNHGDFVSCVAHEHLGGNRVSEAAHSDNGKKDDEDDDNDDEDDISPTVTLILSVIPTATPSDTITPTPTKTPVITPTVTLTPEQEQGLLITQLKGLIDQLKDLMNSLTSFLH